MRVRYFSFLSLAAAAAFLVAATVAYTLPTIDTLALAFGVGMLAVSLGVAVGYREQPATAAAAGAIALVSAWMIVASQVFSLPIVQDLTFAGALAIGGLATAGLIVHELSSERVVHSLELRAGERKRNHSREQVAA